MSTLTGGKTKNLQVKEGRGPMDSYGMTAAAAANVSVLTLGADNKNKVIAWYYGTGAINLTLYAGFPKGSIIHDEQVHKDHEKTGIEGVDTWVSSAARS